MNISMAEDNQVHQFLSAEECKILEKLIGDKHESLVAVHAILYITDFETEPRKKEGVLSIVLNLKNEATTFQMYSLEKNLFLWSKNTPEKQEEYVILEDELHLFKPEDSLFHFRFENSEGGKAFGDVIRRMQLSRRKSDKVAIKGTLELRQNQKSVSKFSKSESDLTAINKEDKPKRQKGRNLKSRFDGELRKEKKKLKKIKKEDISSPFDFRHVSHIGWDANEAFGEALLDPQLKEFLSRAGISETQLRDPETRDFIHEFLEAHGGIETVKKEMSSNTVKELPQSPEPVQIKPPPPLPPEIVARSDQDKQPSIAAVKPVRKSPPYLQNLKTKIADSAKRQALPDPPLPPPRRSDSLESPWVKIDLIDEKLETEKLSSLNTVNSIRRPETVYYSSLPREKKGTFTERFSLNTSAGKQRIIRPAPPLPTIAAKTSDLVVLPAAKASDQETSTTRLSEPEASTAEVKVSEQEGSTNASEHVPTTYPKADELPTVTELTNKEVNADNKLFTKHDSQGSLFIEEKDEISPLKLDEKELPRPVPAPRKKSIQPS